MYSEAPTISHLPGGVREHHITRWVAGRLADALEDNQQGGNRPVPGQRQERHRGHLDDIAEDGDRPVLAALVTEATRNQAQAVSKQFAQAGDDPDRCRTRPKQGKVGANDTARALVGKVREKTHDADQQNELERCGLCL